jgi:NAD(P)-dependent dehydrogenase (short-subunit alcohol dehydrogenase family)
MLPAAYEEAKMKRLDGKVGVITGSGQGIGLEIARFFAKEGAKVVVADIVIQSAQETAKTIQNDGGEAAFIQVDISESSQVQMMVSFATKTYGRLDILCNNAGVLLGDYPLVTELPEENWDRVVNINLKGAYLGCKYAVPEMLKGGGGSIINIASVAALMAAARTAYAASKAGLLGLTRAVALQFAERNIRVNAICPGIVDTPGRRASLKGSPKPNATQPGPQLKSSLVQPMIPRIGTAADIAYLAVYLASDESSWVTGSVFTVDGGQTAR